MWEARRNVTPCFQWAARASSLSRLGVISRVGGCSITVKSTVRINCRNGAPASHLVWRGCHFPNPRTLFRGNEGEHTPQRGILKRRQQVQHDTNLESHITGPCNGIIEEGVSRLRLAVRVLELKHQSLKPSKKPPGDLPPPARRRSSHAREPARDSGVGAQRASAAHFLKGLFILQRVADKIQSCA